MRMEYSTSALNEFLFSKNFCKGITACEKCITKQCGRMNKYIYVFLLYSFPELKQKVPLSYAHVKSTPV